MSQETTENTATATAAASAEKKGVVITMLDGRTVDFGVRGKIKKTVSYVGEGADRVAKLAIDVINGKTYEQIIGLNHPLLLELAAHGASQKISDSFAGTDEGDDIALAIERVIGQLNSGEWSARQGDSMKGLSIVFQAYLEASQVPADSERVAELKAKFLAASEDTIKTIKANPDVKAIMARIQAEQAAARAAKLATAKQETTSAALPVL